jgi:hypothetical protein
MVDRPVASKPDASQVPDVRSLLLWPVAIDEGLKAYVVVPKANVRKGDLLYDAKDVREITCPITDADSPNADNWSMGGCPPMLESDSMLQNRVPCLAVLTIAAPTLAFVATAPPRQA